MRLSVQIEIDKTLDLVTAKNNIIVGRSPKSDIVIPHDSISRNHCRIEVDKGIFYITDLGSSNGSFLDGQKITPEQRTPFLTSSLLTLGKLDCEVSEYSGEEIPGKTVSSDITPKGDYTATMRVSRLDLNKAPRPPEPQKPRPKTPRNPVSEASKKRVQKKTESKRGYIILFIIVAGTVAYLINEGLK